MAGEHRGIHQVTKHHREMATFGLLPARHRGGSRPWHQGLRGRGRPRWYASSTSPYQDAARLVDRQSLSVDEFGLEVVEVGIVEAKPALQRPVRNAVLALEKIEHLCEYLIKGQRPAL
jgi:hypothetical protein